MAAVAMVLIGIATIGQAAQAAPGVTKNVQAACPEATAAGQSECYALARTDIAGAKGIQPNTTPEGYGPSDLLSAYNLPANGGAGQTVAIVDAFDDPNAEADLAVYRSQFGLPACTTDNGCFTKVDENGGTSYPPADPGWAEEISLDLDMVSAVAPNANILLVEAANADTVDLGTADDEAVTLGAKYVSNSWGSGYDSTPGSGEDPGELDDDVYFNHPGVAVVFSSGDDAYGVAYPASSQYVTSVGGTSLVADSSTRGWSESVWNNSFGGPGSGCSLYEPKPAWQTDNGCSMRTVADVSAVADPETGVSVYDSFDFQGWSVFGGTSVSSPIVASIFADAGTPVAGTYPSSYPYADPSALNDVTTGNNGSCAVAYECTAEPGYDGPTGLGTPNGLTAFASGAHGTISGTVTDASGPVDGATISTGGATTHTDAAGDYSIDEPVGDYTVTASAFGDLPSSQDVTVTDGGTVEADFNLETAPTHTVSGTVTDSLTHDPVTGATVSLSPGSLSTTSGADGSYSFASVPEGTYTLSATSGTCDAPYSANLVVDGDKTADIELVAQHDGFGYFCSVSSAPYLQGTTLTSITGDDAAGAVSLPFSFPFYGENYSTAFVATNGFLNFQSANTSFFNESIPDGLAPNAAVYPFWDDLDVDADAGIYTGESTVDGVDAFTIEWRNVRAFSPSTDRMNFSATLLADGRVIFGYGDATDTTTAHGSSATVGLENGDSTIASQYSFDSTFSSTDLTITYALPPQGTVKGKIKDANTGKGIEGATVTATMSNGDTRTATTDSTGAYSLLLFTGRATVEADASNYVSASKSVNIVADTSKTYSPSLAAGRLSVSQTSLAATMGMGASRSKNVKITNTGTAPVTVNLSANNGTFVPAGSSASATTGVITQLTGTATKHATAKAKPAKAGASSTLSKVPVTSRGFSLFGTAKSANPQVSVPADETTITESSSQEIVSGNSASCNNGIETDNNQYLRAFTLSDFGISGAFNVSQVEFGIEENDFDQPVTVNLYTLNGALTYENMTLVGTASTTLDPQSLTLVTVPVTGTVPAGGTLVVEIVASAGGWFFIGSNPDGQSAPSYIASADCAISEPTDTSDIGFPDMDIVMNVSGTTGGSGSGISWLDLQPPTFTLQPGQSATAVVTMTANVDQPGVYGADVVIGNDTPYDVAPIPTTMTVNVPAGWGKITGTVTGDGTPLSGAVVAVDGLVTDVTLVTGADGTYEWWTPKSNGPLTLVVSADGYVPQTKKAQIVRGQTTVYDFDLAPLG